MSVTTTFTVNVQSPKKVDRLLTFSTPPSLNDVRLRMEKVGDTSWDVGNLYQGPNGLIAERPPPIQRPEARKVLVSSLLGEVKGLRQALVAGQVRYIAKQERELAKTERSVESDDIVERHEVVALSLRAFNDLIFNLSRAQRDQNDIVMTSGEKEFLKREGLGYLTRLLEPCEVLTPKVDVMRKSALRILTVDELDLCHALHQKLKAGRGACNRMQHAVPDIPTVLRRLRDLEEDHYRTLAAFLADNPERIPNDDEPADADFRIFAGSGTYVSVQDKLTELWLDRKEKEAEEQTKEKLTR